ncbi:MAG TPA: YciI family protein [Streptosporangiaceae bacterium]
MLLIYSNPAALEALGQDLQGVFAEVEAIMTELTESGEWIGGEALADPVNAKTVHVRDGVPVVTDGPFGEAKEHLAGYCLFECESLERALDIAARWPDARFAGVELRPLMDQSGGPDH